MEWCGGVGGEGSWARVGWGWMGWAILDAAERVSSDGIEWNEHLCGGTVVKGKGDGEGDGEKEGEG